MTWDLNARISTTLRLRGVGVRVEVGVGGGSKSTSTAPNISDAAARGC